MNMLKVFKVDEIEYKLVGHPTQNCPMIARVDGLKIPNRKEICRQFLKTQGWTDNMFSSEKTTMDLEREINRIVNGLLKPSKIGVSNSKHNHASRVKKDVPQPSVELIDYYLDEWNKLEDYKSQEDAIDEIFFGKYNSNDNLQNILIKASILNDFYSTNIYKIYPVAKHILSLNIDERLKQGDTTLVNDIASINIGGKEKNFYSFASKYCSHHNPLAFPIYDSYVHKVLMYYKRADGFFEFAEEDLKNYPKFKEILIKFREFYKLDRYNLKELDKYLWQFGKEYFPKNY